jgi:hypothetical protein
MKKGKIKFEEAFFTAQAMEEVGQVGELCILSVGRVYKASAKTSARLA